MDIFPISTGSDVPELSVRRWRGLSWPVAFALRPHAPHGRAWPGGSDVTREWVEVAFSDGTSGLMRSNAVTLLSAEEECAFH